MNMEYIFNLIDYIYIYELGICGVLENSSVMRKNYPVISNYFNVMKQLTAYVGQVA